MKINIKQVLSGILVSSLASISNAYVSSGTGGEFTTLVSSLVSSGEEKKKGRHSTSFVLPASNRHMLLAARGGHRSHRSHSSHRSGSSGRRSSYSSRSTSTQATPSTSFPSWAPKNDYKLGDREILYGMSGSDVTQLAELLIMHNYLSKQETGNIKYSTQMRQAIIAFQKDARIPATGTCDRETIFKLLIWDKVGTKKKNQVTAYREASSLSSSLSKSATSAKIYKLGDREICNGMSGNDITQLAALLVMYNYLPKQKSDYIIYSKSVRDAVILFQKDAGLPVTGICDRETSKKLQDWGRILAKRKEDARIAGYQERPQQNISDVQNTPVPKKYQLGDRSLKIGSSGPDVDKLISLLIKFRFLPKETKVDFYDLAVYEAVKKAQAKLKIEITGEADYITISNLQDLEGE